MIKFYPGSIPTRTLPSITSPPLPSQLVLSQSPTLRLGSYSQPQIPHRPIRLWLPLCVVGPQVCRSIKMLFCPTCANCLIIQLDDHGNNKWSCQTCPYEFPIIRQMTTRLHLKRKEVDDVMGGEDSWKNVDSTDGELQNPLPPVELSTWSNFRESS